MKKYIFLPLFLLTSHAQSMDNGVTQSVTTLADTLTQLSEFLKAEPKKIYRDVYALERLQKEIREGRMEKFADEAQLDIYLKANNGFTNDLGGPEYTTYRNRVLSDLIEAAPSGGDIKPDGGKSGDKEKPDEGEVKITFEEKVEKIKAAKPKAGELTLGAAEKTGVKFETIAEAEEALVEAGLADKLSKNVAMKNNQLKKFLASAPEKPIKKPAVPGKKITMLTVTNELQMFREMPGDGAEDKLNKRARAKELLNGMLELTQKALKPDDAIKIKDAIVRPTEKSPASILDVDPLLISTAIQVLRNIKIPDEDIYTMITDYYNKAVAKIAKEFKLAKDRLVKSSGFMGGGFAGFCEDIDEALSYPVELESEIQAAKTIVEFHGPTEKEAAAFVAQIKALHQQILQMLKDPAHQKALESCGFDIQFLRNIFEKKEREYCHYNASTGYKSHLFKDELNEVIQNINNYQAKKETLSRIERTYTVQNIITILNGFLDHATNENHCQDCLKSEIDELAKDMNYANKTFTTIEEFLRTVREEEGNRALTVVIDTILPELKDAIRDKGCPLK